MMKMNTRRTKSLLVLALLAAGAGTAQAGTVGKVVTAETQAVFSKVSNVKIEITPRTDVLAGLHKAGSSYGSLKITPASQQDIVAYRWTPNFGVPQHNPDGISVRFREFRGKNNPDNLIRMNLNGSSLADESETEGQGKWLKAKKPGTFDTTLNAVDHRTIQADTYVISVDAAVWAS